MVAGNKTWAMAWWMLQVAPNQHYLSRTKPPLPSLACRQIRCSAWWGLSYVLYPRRVIRGVKYTCSFEKHNPQHSYLCDWAWGCGTVWKSIRHDISAGYAWVNKHCTSSSNYVLEWLPLSNRTGNTRDDYDSTARHSSSSRELPVTQWRTCLICLNVEYLGSDFRSCLSYGYRYLSVHIFDHRYPSRCKIILLAVSYEHRSSLPDLFMHERSWRARHITLSFRSSSRPWSERGMQVNSGVLTLFGIFSALSRIMEQ